ncbi:MAG: gliding motility-associated C-terminal domain-containing protein [Bacteroidales bacterium]|nr:gliding motility-associated C-terminal domain-containing protein [Bacteroidales bacterium]
MCFRITLLIISFLSFSIFINVKGQNVVVLGGNIIVEDDTYFVIQGNLTFKSEITEAECDLNGDILLDGDITNLTSSNVFTNIEISPDGWVTMRNPTLEQHILGATPIHFENLSTLGSAKVLENNNSMVNGLFRLNSVFNLNKRNFIINNSESSSINYIGGYLFAETNSVIGIGSLQWNIGDNTGNYSIPFGSGQTHNCDIAVDYQVDDVGNSAGFVVFSTYPTEVDNLPYPEFVLRTDPFPANVIADRFWIVDAESYLQKPRSSLRLRYTNSDLRAGNIINNRILNPIYYNFSTHTWLKHTLFANNFAHNLMEVTSVDFSSANKNWTIVSHDITGEIFIPNAFTPDTDGLNEVFMPLIGFETETYKLYIYDRWGKILFTSYDPKIGWNGMSGNFCYPIGVYVWKIFLTLPGGKEFSRTGHVSLIK